MFTFLFFIIYICLNIVLYTFRGTCVDVYIGVRDAQSLVFGVVFCISLLGLSLWPLYCVFLLITSLVCQAFLHAT
jgi:hypothetical protein